MRTDVGERLSVLRDVLGITQQELARRTGMDVNHYNMIENGGRHILNGEEARKIAEVGKVTVDWICSGKTAGIAPDMARCLDGMQRAREIARQVMANFAPRRPQKQADVIQFKTKARGSGPPT
jgi:transcriptional regulator with XRE-family HTH domain